MRTPIIFILSFVSCAILFIILDVQFIKNEPKLIQQQCIINTQTHFQSESKDVESKNYPRQRYLEMNGFWFPFLNRIFLTKDDFQKALEESETMANITISEKNSILNVLPTKSEEVSWYYDKLWNPYKSCALVGNGFFVRNSSLGNEINQKDCVGRVNYAPTKGFESDVGTKTTIRMYNLGSVNKIFSGEIVDAEFAVSHYIGHEYPSTAREQMRFLRQIASHNFTIPQITKKDGMTEWVSKKIPPFYSHYPRSGIQLLFLMLPICESLTTYGIRVSDENFTLNKKFSMHYYDNRSPPGHYVKHWHSLFGEFTLLQQLRKLKLINVKAETYPGETIDIV